MAAKLTMRVLNAMQTAVAAMLAGIEGEGDWPDDLPRRDLEAAESWIDAQLARRSALSQHQGGTDALR